MNHYFLQIIYISIPYLYPFNSWWFAKKCGFIYIVLEFHHLTHKVLLMLYFVVLLHGSLPLLFLPLSCSISILIPCDYINEKCFHTHTYIICCFSNSILNFIFLNSMMLSSSFRHRIDCARATLSIQNNRKMLI